MVGSPRRMLVLLLCQLVLLLQSFTAMSFKTSTGFGLRRALTRVRGQQNVDWPFPDEIKREQCLEDIVFCERLPESDSTGGGLVLPSTDKPGQHVARVVSVGPGRNEHSGYVTPNTGIKAGDLVFLKFPWGIGPRDEEYTDETGKLRKFSYIRYQDVAAQSS